jgi:hypothetical protein
MRSLLNSQRFEEAGERIAGMRRETMMNQKPEI